MEKGSFSLDSVSWAGRGEAAWRCPAWSSLCPSIDRLRLGSGTASCRGGPGRAARCPRPPGSARSPCSQRHLPSASASSATQARAPRWAEGPAAARSRRGGSAQREQLESRAEGKAQPKVLVLRRSTTQPEPRRDPRSVLLQHLAGGLGGEDLPSNEITWSVLLRSSNSTFV